MLPVYVNLVARTFLVVAGPTYFKRLWCIWELYTLFVFARDPAEVKLRVISMPGAPSAALALAAFDCCRWAFSCCYDPNEEARIRAVIDAGSDSGVAQSGSMSRYKNSPSSSRSTSDEEAAREAEAVKSPRCLRLKANKLRPRISCPPHAPRHAWLGVTGIHINKPPTLK